MTGVGAGRHRSKTNGEACFAKRSRALLRLVPAAKGIASNKMGLAQQHKKTPDRSGFFFFFYAPYYVNFLDYHIIAISNYWRSNCCIHPTMPGFLSFLVIQCLAPRYTIGWFPNDQQVLLASSHPHRTCITSGAL
jgi:hypothetical protein